MQSFGWPTEVVPSGAAQLRLINPVSLTQADRIAWDELSTAAIPGAFFAHRWFLEPLLGVPGRTLAAVEDPQGLWLGAIALDRVDWLGRLPARFWQGVKDANQFLGAPLIRKASGADFWQALVTGLEALGDGSIGLHLPALPEESEATKMLRHYCHHGDRPLELIRTINRASYTGGQSFTAHFEKNIPSKRRSRLASLARQAEAELGPLRLMQMNEKDEVSQWIDEFLAMELAGWKGQAGSAMACSAHTEKLFRSAVAGAVDQGVALCLTLYAGNVPLARSMQFVDGNVGCGFKTCYDEAYARFAPGLQLLLQITQLISEKQGLHFDSCSTPDQDSINGLWPDRTTINDYCIGFRGRGRSQMFEAVMTLRRLWHRSKGLL
jgi:CelD/BcsL family acetyltransferase involved in cellulose biosynthesis